MKKLSLLFSEFSFHLGWHNTILHFNGPGDLTIVEILFSSEI